MHTIESVGSLFQPLEDVLHQHFIPALTGRDPCSEVERELLTLPCRLGGLNIPNPTTICEFQFSASKKLSGPLASLILRQSDEFSIPSLHSIKSEIRRARQLLLTANFDDVKSRLDSTLQRTMDLLRAKCSSNWLTALPIEEQGFHLNKQEFRDVCHDVAVEPPLQPLSGESITPNSAIRGDDARADIHARGFWGRRQSAFFDIRVFHPNAPSYRHTQIASLFRKHELEKREDMETVSVLSSLLLLHHWFFLLLGVLAGRPPFSTVA